MTHRRPTVLGLLVLALAAAAAPVAAEARVGTRIVNGHQVPTGGAHPYPWMTALVAADVAPGKESDGQFCGGQLVAPTLVLTAGHCAEGLAPRDLDVVVGERDLEQVDAGERFDVADLVLMSGYGAAGEAGNVNDLAMLRLRTAVPGGLATPVALLDPADAAFAEPGDAARILGWGALADPGETLQPYYASKLHEGDVDLVADTACEERYGAVYDPTSMLCASRVEPDGNVVDSCYGDSGGPLIVDRGSGEWRLVGVTSWGDRCASATFPGVYADLVPGSPLRAFASSTPTTWNPYNVTPPRVTGGAVVGSTLTCALGSWANGPTLSRQWARVSESDDFTDVSPIPGATAATYATTPDDLGSDVACVVRARNSVGSAQAISNAVTVVAPPDDGGGGGGFADELPPEVTELGRRCAKGRCTFVLLVEDPEPSLGVSSLSPSLRSTEVRRCPSKVRRRARRKPTCTRTRTRRLAGDLVDGRVWRVRTPRLRRGRHLLSIRPRDDAGNAARKPKRIRFTLGRKLPKRTIALR